MTSRKIVQIDEQKCDGCGLCAPSCAEGAIQIVDGKARLISDSYCDGLGACLGHCPQGAISIMEREAAPFDEEAATQHARAAQSPPREATTARGCPGAALQSLPILNPAGERKSPGRNGREAAEPPRSGLANWPVQLRLVPPQAPFLAGADLLLVADCAPVACGDFHRRFLDGRPVLIACPKLDDGEFYVQKLAEIFRTARPRSVTVLHMEVPCCTGLLRIAEAAASLAGADAPLQSVVLSIRGAVLDHRPAPIGCR
jgi:Fe-S-cluster-containing hydrogenase component 2